MEFFISSFDPDTLYNWETLLNDYIFLGTSALFLFELVRYAVKGEMSWNLAGDALSSFTTFAFFTLIALLVGTAYVAGYYLVYEFRVWEFPVSGWSILLCLVLADLTYYCEHRFTHRTGIGWASHTVHHSSTHFNISVAYRFGPLDILFPFFFAVPLLLAGFHPLLVLFAEAVVLIYQTVLHTESIGKLPRPIEWLFNTPSHHRVHHGSNPEYIDKNYGGILIIWDRIFGTFAEEQTRVKYGLVTPVDSLNPFKVFFHGLTRLFAKIRSRRGWKAY